MVFYTSRSCNTVYPDAAGHEMIIFSRLKTQNKDMFQHGNNVLIAHPVFNKSDYDSKFQTINVFQKHVSQHYFNKSKGKLT